VAAELYETLGIKANFVEEKQNIFDIFLDGNLIYSLSESGRFPEPGEIVTMLQQ